MNPVFFFWPNLVGYCRILATAYAFYICFHSHAQAALFYIVVQALDAVDGPVARKFGQSTKYGAVLDMLTDRMSTAVLLVVLSHLYPNEWGLYTFLIVLDIVSHWYQMYSKSLMGETTHKGSKNPLLNFYYTFPYALLVFCVGNESYLVAQYLMKFWRGPAFTIAGISTDFVTVVAKVCFPIFVGKQFMNFVQLYDAAGEVAAYDLRMRNQPMMTTQQQRSRKVT